MNKLDDVKATLRSLLVSSPVKSTVFRLNKEFKEVEGIDIPFRNFGYISLLHFLNSIPDVLRVHGSSLNSEISLVSSQKTEHVRNLIDKQKRPTKGRLSQMGRMSVISTTPKSFNSNMSDYNYNMNPADVQRPTSSEIPQKTQSQNNIKVVKFSDSTYFQKTPFKEKPLNLHTEIPKTQNEDNSLNNLANQFRKIDIIQGTNSIKNLSITFSNDDANTNKIDVIKDKNKIVIPRNIQVNLQLLISKFPSGLLCTQLTGEYERMFNAKLNFEKFGFTSLPMFCFNLEDIFYCEKHSSFDYLIFDKRRALQREKLIDEMTQQIPDIDPNVIIPTCCSDWSKNSMPENVFKLGEKLKHDLIESIHVGESIEIVVSEVIDPDKFWFYKNDGTLDNFFTNEMQMFYKENARNYLVPEYLLEVGLYCVVHIFGEFQRGLIIDLIPDIGGYVRIYFMDYGTVTNIPRSMIWFLDKKFSILPAQALQAKLAGIRPIDSEYWSKESGSRFTDLISSKKIIAKIIDKENNKLSIEIAEVENPDFSINDVLVNERFAQHSIEASSPKTMVIRRVLEILKKRKIQEIQMAED